MEKPLISVIIPAYNVSSYIEKCIGTVIGQDFQNFEVLLVDDGSTDNTSTLCDHFAQKDPRINVYHKKNGGLSDARNYGIDRAHGEFLTFVDSDDYLALDYLSYLKYLIDKAPGCKLAICSLYDVYSANKKVVDNGNGQEMVLSPETCLKMMCYHNLVDTCAYAKLYHRSLFNRIRYPKGKLFEDIGTTYQLIEQCNQISCGFQPKYYYVLRPGSIVNSSYSPNKLDLLEMTDQMATEISARYPSLESATLRRRVYSRFSTLNQMLDVKDRNAVIEREKIIKFIYDHQRAVMSDPLAPRRDKVAIRLLQLGFPIYRFFWKEYRKIKKGV